MKKIVLLLMLSSLFITPTSVFSAPVYDNTTNSLFMNLYASGEVGDEITLAGTERLVTEFSFGYSNANKTGNENAHIRFYLNDGVDGKPHTLLYDLGIYSLEPDTLKHDLTISGLSILIPSDTFTWTVEWGNTYPNSYPSLPLFDPPTIGSSGDYLWQYAASSWGKIDTIYIDNIKAQIKAESIPVPEPSSLLLLGAGLAGVGILRRRFRK